MNVVGALHVVASVFLVAPAAVAGVLSARYVKAGADGVGALDVLNKVTRYGTIATVVVFALGVGAVVTGDWDFGSAWLSISIALYLVAVGLTVALVERDQRSALSTIREGGSAAPQASRIYGVGAAAALLWVVITALMYYKPGA